MKITTKFDIGQYVVIKTDRDKLQRIITNIKICPNDCIYYAAFGEKGSEHYEMELEAAETKEKSIAGFASNGEKK